MTYPVKCLPVVLVAVVGRLICSPGLAAEPRDLDAELRARMAAWLKGATPPPAAEDASAAEREAFVEGFRDGAAPFVSR